MMHRHKVSHARQAPGNGWLLLIKTGYDIVSHLANPRNGIEDRKYASSVGHMAICLPEKPLVDGPGQQTLDGP